ncbi:nicotinate-nucleotide adenylyltransferase [Jeotgalibacillus marinus]|uniref:Probable nicotinate-nucleotide adenylyltransferase n=1 Tax=Jeotgalibacillus marinus TaxID=86667 RepID=A0ABV3PZH6_9BACL
MTAKKVGILGGTFDPLHVGHLLIANEVYHALSLDEVRFMPSGRPPHKNTSGGASDEHRIKMVEMAIEEIPYFRLELIEFERSGPSYTYDTIIRLKKRDPGVQFYFIIGGDMIDYLPRWSRITELAGEVQFVGVRRHGSSGETDYPVQMIQTPMIDLSSTLLRQRIRNGIDVTFLLPQKVYDYITKEELYES